MENEVPEVVLDALAAVREDGSCNMLARREVIRAVFNLGDDNPEFFAAATWLHENKDRYMEALIKMGETRGE